MDILTPMEIDNFIARSALVRKYNQTIDRESAYEILNEKLAEAQELSEKPAAEKPTAQKAVAKPKGRAEKSVLEKVISDPTTRQIGRTVARELTRGLLGVLGIGGSSSSRRKKSSWF